MIKPFESILFSLFHASNRENGFFLLDPSEFFNPNRNDHMGIAQTLNSAFMIALIGQKHPLFSQAMDFLIRMSKSPVWAQTAHFYLDGVTLVQAEIEDVFVSDHEFANHLNELHDYISTKETSPQYDCVREKIWSVFFPEAVGIEDDRQANITNLRKKRTVTITGLNQSPISDPGREILFTSNILLTIPRALEDADTNYLGDNLKERLKNIMKEPQIYWYDHPIQMGIAPGKNEILHGLRGLEEAFAFERKMGNMTPDLRPVCLLSISVTHKGLHEIAKDYLQEALSLAGGIKDLALYVFTEKDTRQIIDEILAPAVQHYGIKENNHGLLQIFGVDGEYGRHYNFLKAMAAFWAILIHPEIKATYKIDLDQVFPQKELRQETGSTIFEHFKTPLWGSKGVASNGRSLDMGMIAGTLVNEKDISTSLFTPDIGFPDSQPAPYEYIFYSRLPQALSTEAEMMTRYLDGPLDGIQKAIQRIHVTGGTNGILIKSLRRHRPFTPSFIGRAEDQAYILSVLLGNDERVAYVHKDGLIMRHDKEAFAQKAIQSAYVGKLLGDYIRILYFSAYAKVLCKEISKVKEEIDPFTGCFISKIPKTVVYLRFALQSASFFNEGETKQGLEFVNSGSHRLSQALAFIDEKKGMIQEQYEEERLGWDLYYDTLSFIEDGLRDGDGFSKDLQKKAIHIINQCAIK
ncbi:MAG: hypothetical protein JW932_01670 [Deltaproteobacteria bacterium]|nr:hypothetical protein [Deltaproteobacteria bacterium]